MIGEQLYAIGMNRGRVYHAVRKISPNIYPNPEFTYVRTECSQWIVARKDEISIVPFDELPDPDQRCRTCVKLMTKRAIRADRAERKP